MFKGSFVALITPFSNGRIDEKAFCSLVERQIECGTDGLVVCGTTGEAATMSADEYAAMIALCVKTTGGRVPVLAGTGSNSTEKTIETTRVARSEGADAALIVTPYYNKPSQEGLYRHYVAVAEAVDLPVMLYDVPSRTGVKLSVETIARLAKLPQIIGIKDATGDLSRPIEIRKVVPDGFAIMSGDDASVVAFLAHGGDGCISVTANVAPAECAALHDAWAVKDWETVFRLRDRLFPLHRALFVESNPGPVKYACSLQCFGDGSLRLPLFKISAESETIVKKAMKDALGESYGG